MGIDKKILLKAKKTYQEQWFRIKDYKDTKIEKCPYCDSDGSDCPLCDGSPIESINKTFDIFSEERDNLYNEIMIFNRDLKDAGIEKIKLNSEKS